MSLKKNSRGGIGPRLIVWSTLLLTFSLIIVSTTVYYLLSNSLRENDHALLKRLALSYSQSIKLHQGFSKLSSEISPEVMVKVLNADGTELYSQLPKIIEGDFEDEDEIQQIDQAVKKMPIADGFETVLLLSGEEDHDFFQRSEFWLRKFAFNKKWTSILPMIDNDLFEVYSMKLSNGGVIRVGRSSEETEEHLSDIRKISMLVIVPFVFIGLFLNFLLSKSILAPLKELAETIEKIKKGDLKARGKIFGSGDEVDLLSEEFNSLVEQNEKLITNLKNTIDNVAHDLRTPLTRFRVSAENALTRFDDKEVFREALQDGLENADKMKDLLNAIMDVSEAESMTMSIKSEVINLEELLANLEDLYLYSAEDKKIQIIREVEKDLRVKGDITRLSQALGNLLDNALKFSPEFSIVTLKASRKGDDVLIEVVDQGMGVEESEKERIWERLYRGDKSRSTSGMGIGLSVVRAIIRAHYGEVWVENSTTKGSIFVVRLPFCHDPVIIP